jgi:hypothetical protein
MTSAQTQPEKFGFVFNIHHENILLGEMHYLMHSSFICCYGGFSQRQSIIKIEIDNRNRQAKNDRQSIVGDNRYITTFDAAWSG